MQHNRFVCTTIMKIKRKKTNKKKTGTEYLQQQKVHNEEITYCCVFCWTLKNITK